MANKQLIQGAGIAANKFQSYRLFEQNKEMGRQMQMQRMYQDKKVRQYIDALGPGAEVDKLPGSMQEPVQDYLNDNRMKYGQLARYVAKAPAGSPQYMKAQAEMYKIQSQFKGLSSQLDNFKNLKQEYLADFDEGIISNGSKNQKVLKELFSTDDYKVNLSDGSLKFVLENGEEVAGSNLPKYFNRNAKAVDGLLKLNQQAYKNALPIDRTSDYLYRRQVRQLATAGGRDGLLSLATDAFLDAPLIDIDNPNDPNYGLLNEDNHEQLRDFVINSWMDGISSAANQAYMVKSRSSRPQGSGLDLNTAMQAWKENDLYQLMNLLPIDSKINIEEVDDGTWDISVPGRKMPFNINPEDDATLGLYLKALGIRGGNITPNVGATIDLDKI